MKKFILTTLFILLISILNVNAETTSFYEAEYIDNIYISKYQYSNNTIYYQKARLFRENNTHEIAYCIEPFIFFNKDAEYKSTTNINNISNEKLDTIKRIVYFGYGYENHLDLKWYAITQYMIWQETVENGEIFFTDKLNGKKIYPYTNEINEIKTLINNSKIKPSFINEKHTVIENNDLILEDSNNILNNYETDKNIIDNNKLKIENITKDNNKIHLYRKYKNHNKPHVFFQSDNSQNLVKIGNMDEEKIELNLKIINSKINIKKIDYDTKDIYPQGDAELNNAIIGLYNKNMELINKYTITNNIIEIKNLNFGEYYIKELQPGKGYNLNDTIYKINITKDKYEHSINIENKIIKKNITIEKKYGEENNLSNEKNIYFEIYNKDNKIIDIVKTDEQGKADFILPYGEYIIKQLNTTNGYQKIEPFTIQILDQKDETITLTDYKIPIPNTSKNNLLTSILILLLKLLNI